mmetsp:Transcript_8439/g.21575  ORF Transcript_8439/g.21575 Transcript_8439/m.21575 type:complete len:132 (-) Transcript_8439:218-613(-)
MLEPALVGVGAGAGAMLRYAVAAKAARTAPRCPATATSRAMWSIAAVNVAGSFTLGCVAGAGVPRRQALLLGTGACGGFTTYSTFALDSARLLGERRLGVAVLYIGASAIGSIAAAAAGMAVGARFARGRR